MSSQRKIYFIRHAHPDIPIDERWCVGSRADLSLNALGRMQACLLAKELESADLTGVYCSRLKRACETASFLSPDYVCFGGLEEKDMGDWDGLSFEQIKNDWPEIYALREEDMSVTPPGAEPVESAKYRFRQGIEFVKLLTKGDIALVSHGGIMRDFFGNEKLPYTGYFITDKDFNIISENRLPHPDMTPQLCLELQEAAELLPNIRAHCISEAAFALEIGKELNAHGFELDLNLIECSALLHDIARLSRQHEKVGGRYLSILGYDEIGSIIRQHDEPESEEISEATVLFIADMNTIENHRCSVDERFEYSYTRYLLPRYEQMKELGILEVHARRREMAIRIKEKINNICGKELVK